MSGRSWVMLKGAFQVSANFLLTSSSCATRGLDILKCGVGEEVRGYRPVVCRLYSFNSEGVAGRVSEARCVLCLRMSSP
jgi:hypothetical protein